METKMFEYIAQENKDGGIALATSYGFPIAKSPQELAYQLKMCVNRDGKKALHKLASIHPDVELFEDVMQTYDLENKKEDVLTTKELLNHFSNMSGQTIKSNLTDAQKQESSNTKDLFIVGAVVVLALAIIKS